VRKNKSFGSFYLYKPQPNRGEKKGKRRSSRWVPFTSGGKRRKEKGGGREKHHPATSLSLKERASGKEKGGKRGRA